MSLKTFVKDDLWRVNYIYPFAKKHLAEKKKKKNLQNISYLHIRIFIV